MQNSQKISAVFYTPLEEVRTGYLYKSPPYSLLKSERSWKRRYFMLLWSKERGYQLKYFRSAEDKDKPVGSIDLMQISVLFTKPENHPKWGWVEKNLRCSPSRVLYIKTVERDYFLVGDNSREVDQWFSDLYNALKHRPHKFFNSEVKATRSVSDPPPMRSKSFSEEQQRVAPPQRCVSEPVEPIYDYPRSYLIKLQNEEKRKDKDSAADSNIYMSMRTVFSQEEETAERSGPARPVARAPAPPPPAPIEEEEDPEENLFIF